MLTDTIGNLFDFIPETNITEEYLYNHPGEYPVYSGQTEAQGILGYIDSFNQHLPSVTFTTYGVGAGKLFYRQGKYTIGRNCMGLRPKETYTGKINLKWFSYSFQNTFYRLRIGDTDGQRSLNKLLLERQVITIPDIEIQNKQLIKYGHLELALQRLDRLLVSLQKISNQIQ
jgi:type I restriction enzyme S subunit